MKVTDTHLIVVMFPSIEIQTELASWDLLRLAVETKIGFLGW